jgi:hypothetical protein
MKKVREEVKPNGGHSLYDLFDDMIKQMFNITDEEYDFIAEHATDEDLSTFLEALGTLDTESTFTQRRKSLEVRNKYLEMYKQT